MTECMKKKKTLMLSGDFRFRFSAKHECPFSLSAEKRISSSSACSVTAENEKKNVFGRPLVHIKKGLGLSLGLEMQGLGLGLEIKVLVLILVLKES